MLLYLDVETDRFRQTFANTTMTEAIKNGFRFSTFTNGTETLVHLKKAVTVVDSETVMYVAAWSSGEPVTAWPVALSEVDDRDSSPGREGESVSSSEAYPQALYKIGDDDCLEFTSFNGHPLPVSLLAYVYERIDLEREWSEGQRGLSLPEDVWQLLRDWATEIVIAGHS